MMKKTLCVMFLLTMASAGSVFAECGNPGNGLTGDDCGFEATIGAWTAIPPLFPGDPDWGTPAHTTTGPRTGVGAMMVDAMENIPGPPNPPVPTYNAGAQVCVTDAGVLASLLVEGTEIGFGGYVNPSIGPGAGCDVLLWIDTGAACEIGAYQQVYHPNPMIPAGTYTKLNHTDDVLTVDASGATGQSIGLKFACTDYAADFVATFDDAYIGADMVPVQLQSFSIE